ncbi:MAG: hypothetical protein IEMM0002_1408 [bacterium]|nr:MAG: hypothetical protein IEMM0002_1408 [bacterium]
MTKAEPRRCSRSRKTGITDYKKLRDLPGIGPKMEKALVKLGIVEPENLIGADPSEMYERWQTQTGVTERCVLYVFRCIVYCAKTPASKRNPDLTKWWNWKD